jgi:hypothetical protein
MGKASTSVGDDTPTGEPENAPSGPYITDDYDGSLPHKGKLPDNDAGAHVPRPKAPTPQVKRPPGAVRTDF